MSAAVPKLCSKCSMPLGSVSVWIGDRAYHVECCPHPLPYPLAPTTPMTIAKLIERLRNAVNYRISGPDAGHAAALFHEAADALASSQEEIARLKGLLEIQIAGHRLSAKDATQNLIRASKAEAELALWQTVKHSSHWKDRANASEAEIARLRKALEPFARARDHFDSHVRDEDTVDISLRHIRAHHVFAAARAFASQPGASR